jgi:phospholipid transport system substrate-binding protein
MNKTILRLLAATAVMVSCALQAADLAPDALAKSVSDEVISIIKADKDLQAGNTQKLMQLVEVKVLPHFNFSRMTQLAMGRNWRQANPEQQKTLVNEFSSLLVRTYTTAFTQYKDQSITFRPIRLAPTDTDVVVKSQINQPGGQPVAIDYSMEKSERGWKVYDVKIEGISLVENYRNTFNAEVQKGGVDGLIKTLGQKNSSAHTQAKK